jgi:hypothetical protein
MLRFDPLLRAGAADLREAIARLAAELERDEAALNTRTRKRKATPRAGFVLAVECVLCNLIAARQSSPQARLAVPLSNSVLRGSPRYRPPVYGQHFHDLIELLHLHLGLIEVEKGYHVRKYGRRKRTTILPTPAFLARFPALTTEATAGTFTRVDPPETIILKDVTKQPVNYRDSPTTRQWREEMREINAHLRDADIALVANEALADDAGFIVRPEVRSLRRIWNGSWHEGGRLYDGFWQTIPREVRLHVLRIGGEAVANVDFCQFNLRLAYALAGVVPPPGDLYDVTGQDALRPDWKRLREGRKKITNAMFNVAAPFKGWPGKTIEDRRTVAACFPPGTKPSTVISDIRRKHLAIADCFEHGRGLGFMFTEASILVATLLNLLRRGITALPIHDAVLVAESHAEIARGTLEAEAKRLCNAAIPAEIKTAVT